MTVRNLDALFRARQVVILGQANDPPRSQLLANLEASVPTERRVHIASRRARRPPDTPVELAVILDERWAHEHTIEVLAQRGCRAVLWAAPTAVPSAALRAARPSNLRIIGARSAGVIDTRAPVNASSLPLAPRAGQVALIAQSQSLAAAALDWALGRNVGFSWLAATGAEADVDVADLLDYAALDPHTRAVVLQVGRIRAPRKFMSAARAAARVKPVLVLQTRRTVEAGPRGPDPARSAAFARAGLVECENLGGLFDGLTALELLPKVSGRRIGVVGNGAGACALATDAMARQDLAPTPIGAQAREVLAEAAPQARDHGGAVDLGRSDLDETVAALRAIIGDARLDGVLFVHSPVAGQPHEPLVTALARADVGPRLMSVWLGLHTARAARKASADARLATFASADEAVRALGYRARHRFTRELLTATPPPDPSVTADVDALRRRLDTLAASGVEWLSADEAVHLLTAYGIAGEPPGATASRIRVQAEPHPELGMILRVSDDTLGVAPAYGFAPLDRLLARRMLEAASAGRLRASRAAMEGLGHALVRLGKLIVDQPHVISLDVHVAAGERGRLHASASLIGLTANPPAGRERLAMAPYPARMRHRVTLEGDIRYALRAIRPSDEPAVLGLLESLSPEEIRLRFFNQIRHFSHDMAARITQVDYDREVSLVASADDAGAALAGMGTLISDPDGREAEYAILVHHDHGRRGLGRHLLDCLLRQAGARGVETVYGEVLAHNRPMLALARSLGFKAKISPEDATSVRVDIAVADYMARI